MGAYSRKVWLAGILSLFIATGKTYPQENRLFGKAGVRYSIPPGKFPKWDDMLSRWHASEGLQDQQCETGLFSNCYLRELYELTQQIQNEPEHKRIKLINDFVNQIRYREDIDIYGLEDYWAIAPEFFDNEFGDCEDYSIAKYFALKASGFATNSLQIAVVKDINLNLYHAILVVRYNEHNYILDNRLYDATTDDKLMQYQPLYTINENYWWFFH